MENTNEIKYLKYKKKYLELKAQNGNGYGSGTVPVWKMVGVLYSNYYVVIEKVKSNKCVIEPGYERTDGRGIRKYIPKRKTCSMLTRIRYVKKNKDGTYTDTGKNDLIDSDKLNKNTHDGDMHVNSLIFL